MTFKSQENGFFTQAARESDPSYPATAHGTQMNTDEHDEQQPLYVNDAQTNFDKRGSVATLSQMTNPFRTKIYNQQPNMTMMTQSDINQTRSNIGMHPLQHSQDSKLHEAFSDGDQQEINQTMPTGVTHGQPLHQHQHHQESAHDADPSSSSMSGYDLNNMFQKAQANQQHLPP